MSYRAPKVKDVVQETPPPLINISETSADMVNQRNKRGLLSTFLQGSRNRTAGVISKALSNLTPTTGKSIV